MGAIVHAERDDAPVPRSRVELRGGLVASLVVASLVASVLVPRDLAAVGILVLGPLHVVRELTVVRGARPSLFTRRWWPIWVLSLLGALARFSHQPVEIEAAMFGALGGLGLATLATARNGRGGSATSPRTSNETDVVSFGLAAVLAGAGCVVVAAMSPAWWVVTIAHLHNLLPLVVLSVALVRGRRGRVAAGVVIGYAGSALLLLGGGLDAALRHGWSHPATGDGAATSLPLATRVVTAGAVSSTVALRLVAAFTFAQLVHYAIWTSGIRERPQPGPAPGPDRRDAAGRRTGVVGSGIGAATGTVIGIVIALVASAVLLAVASKDLALARRIYTAGALVHVLVELPALGALLLLTPDGVDHRDSHKIKKINKINKSNKINNTAR